MAYPRLVNKGFTFLNMENASVGLTKQIVVVGVSRGGTSAIAGSLYHLGVHVGDTAKPPVFYHHGFLRIFG
jgi:chemotaxis response regulator CheB